MTKQPATYILASTRNGTLYIGVTANIPARIHQHKQSLIPGLTAKHRCHIYFGRAGASFPLRRQAPSLDGIETE